MALGIHMAITTLVAGGVGADDGARPLPWRGPDMPRMSGLIQNQDCTDFFYGGRTLDDVDGGALLDAYVDTLSEAGVTVMMVNTNARRTNYRSEVWEAFWDGYDPDGPDDQPFLRSIPAGSRAGYRSLIHNMWALDAQGVDYPARAIERCRLREISPWVTLRMNDVHENDNLDHPFHGTLWRDATYHRGGPATYYSRGLDYGHPEVRELYRKLVVETLGRYDIDGLELDFMREPYLFKPGAEEGGGAILREWLRGIRRLTHDAGVRRGHPVRLAVRVPSRIEVAQSWGLDAVGWAKDGLVDLVIATPRWSTLEFDMPMGEWREALADTGASLAGGLEVLYRPLPNGPPTHVTHEQAAGAAASVLAGGADVVYLFNFFAGEHSHPSWTREDYRRTLSAMSSLEALNGLPRRHSVTWRDIIGRDEAYTPPLPAEGTEFAFRLQTGPRPPEGASAWLEVGLARDQAPRGFTATVNGTRCTVEGPAGNLQRFSIPLEALPGGQRDEVTVTAEAPVRVESLEIVVVPADGE